MLVLRWCARQQRARSRSSRERRTFRDESASPSASRTVGRTRTSSPRVEVANHALDHGGSLRVLLPEVRDVRPDGEELEADRGDTAEVSRPVDTEDRAESLDVDPGLEPGRIDPAALGTKSKVDSGGGGEALVPRLVAR